MGCVVSYTGEAIKSDPGSPVGETNLCVSWPIHSRALVHKLASLLYQQCGLLSVRKTPTTET